MTTAPAPTTAAPGPEIQEPTLTQQLMLDAPWGDDLCIISARAPARAGALPWWWPVMRRIGRPNTAA